MKASHRYSQIFFFLFSLPFIMSCNGQKKTDPPKNNSPQATQSIINLSDTDPYFVESQTITSAYGPSSITRNIIQDRKGNFWLATWEGIIRYDGDSFTNFTNQEGLRRFHAFAALEDRKGTLWFGTIGAGVYRYDGKSFTNFTTKDGLPNDRVTNIYEDKNGDIWFGTEGGASRYDGRVFHNFTTKEGLPNNDVNAIIEDNTGKFWFGTRGDACFYDGETFTTFTNKEGSAFTNVRSIIKDRKGNIWLGGNDGLWCYDHHSFTNLTTDFVGYIYEDKKGNIWTSTARGNMQTWVLHRYDEKSWSDKKISPAQFEPQVGMLFGILEDTEENIWFGTLNGIGRYDGKSFNFFQKKQARD